MREFTGIDPHKLTVNPTIGNGGGVPFANASGAIIPPFACMEVVGDAGGLIANVRKPTSAGINPSGLLFNGAKAIPVGGQGLAQSGETTISMINPTTDMTDGYDVSLGSVSGQWYLDAGQAGYRASTYQTGTALGRCAVVRPFNSSVRILKTSATFTELTSTVRTLTWSPTIAFESPFVEPSPPIGYGNEFSLYALDSLGALVVAQEARLRIRSTYADAITSYVYMESKVSIRMQYADGSFSGSMFGGNLVSRGAMNSTLVGSFPALGESNLHPNGLYNSTSSKSVIGMQIGIEVISIPNIDGVTYSDFTMTESGVASPFKIALVISKIKL